jgi:hypothetical protein
MSESRPARRDSTGLEAEEMVTVEEERYASTPFELGGCVFLFSIALVDVLSDERRWDGGLTSTTGENVIPSSLTVSLSPASIVDLLGVCCSIPRMKP